MGLLLLRRVANNEGKQQKTPSGKAFAKELSGALVNFMTYGNLKDFFDLE